jgi:hypothetical protein
MAKRVRLYLCVWTRTGKLSKTSDRRSAKRSTAARDGSDEGISGAKGRDNVRLLTGF